MTRWILVAGAGVGLFFAAAEATAHAVVFPGDAVPGAYQKYVLRVPTERAHATVRVAMTFPREVRVISFGDVPGWDLEVTETEEGDITAAAWTGQLPPNRFVELPFVAVNPTSDTRIVWKVAQTYADGFEVAWDGPEDSNTPASVTVISTPVEEADELALADHQHQPGSALPLAFGALVVAALSLGLALRPRA